MATKSRGAGVNRGVFHVTLTTSQTGFTPSSPATSPVNFDTVGINHFGVWDTTNHRFTCQEDGYYFFYGSIFALCNGDTPQADIYKNSGATKLANGTYIPAGMGTGSAAVSAVQGTFFLLAGDTVDLRAHLPATITAVSGDVTRTFFGGYKVEG